jgi:small GTP-binding protein
MYVWKILIGGAGGVGKTALINRYVKNTFEMNVKMTIGVGFVFQEIIHNDTTIKMQFWDLSGQDRFQFILEGYCKGAAGAFVLFDASSLDTIDDVANWIEMFKRSSPCIPVIW